MDRLETNFIVVLLIGIFSMLVGIFTVIGHCSELLSIIAGVK